MLRHHLRHLHIRLITLFIHLIFPDRHNSKEIPQYRDLLHGRRRRPAGIGENQQNGKHCCRASDRTDSPFSSDSLFLFLRSHHCLLHLLFSLFRYHNSIILPFPLLHTLSLLSPYIFSASPPHGTGGSSPYSPSGP